ncbi:MAG: hypothetical protein SGJ16_08790 [Nitrospirota bacterium]|nr:hypothetical protein [Nitrospirota bacterium]
MHNQVASALLKKTSLLTGSEARFLRKWLRLTSDELAKALGFTRVSVSRRENKGLTVATDRSLRLYASRVGNISIDVEKLFPTINDEPDKNFRVVVGDVLPVLQYSVNASGAALAIAEAHELAGISTGIQYSVKASGTATVVTSAKCFIDMLTNFDEAFAMSSKYVGGTGKEPDKAANQDLAQAA